MKKAYPEYKVTGLSWIPIIPINWKKAPITSITQPRSEKGRDDLPLLSVYRDFGVILKDSRDDNHNRAGEDLTSYKIVRKGNLVLNKMKTWQGSLGISRYEGLVSPAYIVCDVSNEVYGEFMHYLLRSNNYIYEYNRLSYGIRNDQWDMRYEDFKRIPVFLPPLPEQRQIAAFLDHKCSLIDTFIQKKTRLIELLKEQKQAIINKAVTKGIDPNARLKPSGIEWLGDIPEHWEVKKLKYLIKSMTSGGTPSMEKQEFWDGEIPWVSPKDMKSFEIWGSEMKITNNAIVETSLNLLPKNSILLVVRSGILQRILPVSINKVPVTINQDLKAIIPISTVLTEYFATMLKGLELEILVNCRKVVATVESIEIPYLVGFFLSIPPISEQIEILRWIKSESIIIDRAITRIEREIALLQEYKTTLIAEAVTGKIDVRGWRPKEHPLPLETSKAAIQ